jgi:2',3'-cyclic-nucleotide 2'-phosphodiesterase (5'-nucleotidase family)
MRRIAVLAALLGALLLALGGAMAAAKPGTPKGPPEGKGPKDRTPVTIQFLNVSDWHGQLDPVGGVGGAAVLSTYFQQERAQNPNTLTLTAGDAYGATPPLSNFFDEVPAVYAMRMMGFDVDTFGNHNFDRGIDHLQQMIDIVNAPAGGEHPGTPFRYVAANLQNRDDNLSGVADWHIFDVGGVKVGVVGLVNEEAPTLVFPGSFGTIEITDSVRAANKARVEMQRAGAQIMVAITHKGVRGFDGFGNPFGELIDFADNVGGFDVIFGDHTDIEYRGIHGKAVVSMNRSKGVRYSRTTLTVDPVNGRVTDRSVEFVTPVAANVTPDPAIVAMLQPFRDQLGPIFRTVVGESTIFIPHSDACGTPNGRSCESLIGNVVTDAMRLTYETDFAITNAGGLRAALSCPIADDPADFCDPYTPPPYPTTRGQVNTVLPFGNIVVTLDLNGAELKSWLERGVSGLPGAAGHLAQVSGLCFTYNLDNAVGSRVLGAVRQAADGTCTGAPIDLTSAATYSLATNDFMASGGDGYPVLMPRATTREIMDQAVADWLTANSPITPSIQGRHNCIGGSCPTPTP